MTHPNSSTTVAISTESTLNFTGERFHPDRAGEMWYEHWHRYAAIAPMVKHKRVLDIASGEGYGSASLAQTARHVIGVDISAAAVTHAQTQYANVSNLQFITGDCSAIPLADASVDVVVSFETLEHIRAHDAFLREIRRVLSPNGLCIISTPNRAEYSDARGYRNEYHVKELYLDEFNTLLAQHFKHHKMLSQRNGFHSLIQPMPIGDSEHHRDTTEGVLTIGSMSAQDGQLPAPLYVIALASDNATQLNTLQLPTSAFTAKEDKQIEVFMQIWRHSQHLEARVADLTQQNHTQEETIAALSNQLGQLQTQHITANAPVPTTTNDSALARFIKKFSQ